MEQETTTWQSGRVYTVDSTYSVECSCPASRSSSSGRIQDSRPTFCKTRDVGRTFINGPKAFVQAFAQNHFYFKRLISEN